MSLMQTRKRAASKKTGSTWNHGWSLLRWMSLNSKVAPNREAEQTRATVPLTLTDWPREREREWWALLRSYVLPRQRGKSIGKDTNAGCGGSEEPASPQASMPDAMFEKKYSPHQPIGDTLSAMQNVRRRRSLQNCQMRSLVSGKRHKERTQSRSADVGAWSAS